MYQYDPLGWTGNVGYGSTNAWAANVFTAETDEILEAVSFYTTDTDTLYDIYVYLDPTTGGPINSSGAVVTKSGSFSEPGYHTVPLDRGVQVRSGQDFSVVIEFNTAGDLYPIAMEYPYLGYSSKAIANAGESFISAYGSTWSDLTDDYADTNVCIKAFTSSIITVDDSGLADYTSIQAAVNNASEGFTLLVYPGTYNENVNVDKQLDIVSTDGAAVTNVTAASSDDHVFNVTADEVTISGFNVDGATGNQKAGICLYNSSNNMLTNNTVSENNIGILLDGSGSNIIYNNHFNNSVNTYFSGMNTANVWNTTKTSGVNIAGGFYLGGNYWSKPDSTGFSKTHEDLDGDGICDDEYVLEDDNIDHLPLAIRNSQPVAQILSISPNPSVVGNPVSFTGTGSDPDGYITDYNWVSSIDGLLSTSKNFMTSGLSAGTHTIYFNVRDDYGDWSVDVSQMVVDIVCITVDDSGSADYTSIQDAVNAATPGDIIRVYPGTYVENIDVDEQLNITSTNGASVTNVIAEFNSENIFNITADRVTINGFNVSGGSNGISLSYSSNCMLTNNTVTDNILGIALYHSSNNTLTSNTIADNDDYGIRVEVSDYNLIYNNFFNNTINIFLDGIVTGNIWNSSTSGNYWAKPDGTGFSQTTKDTDGDGICDAIYVLDDYNIDYLPLAQWGKKISIGSSTIYEKSSVTIPVELSGIADVTGCSFDLLYNSSVVTVEDISHNNSFTGMSLSWDIDNMNGTTSVVLTCTDPLTLSSPLPVIFIDFNATGSYGDSTDLDLVNVELSGTDFIPHSPDVVINGSITVVIKGDFNDNGRVDIGDVSKVAFMVAGKIPEDLAADFNNNGRVDIGDAAKIAFYLAGKVSEL